jgi:hypothetical protein
MVAQLEDGDSLLQVDAVAAIEKLFGPDYVYVSDIGEKSIDKRVLNQFRKLTADDVVWVTLHGGGYWSGPTGGSAEPETPRAERSTNTDNGGDRKEDGARFGVRPTPSAVTVGRSTLDRDPMTTGHTVDYQRSSVGGAIQSGL